MGFSFLYIIHMCVPFQKILAQIRKKKYVFQKKESVSVHRYERTYMAVKCEMFMNYKKNFKGICQKQITKHGMLK